MMEKHQLGDEYYATFGVVMFRFAHLHEDREDAVRAELTVSIALPGAPDPALWDVLPLSSTLRITQVAKKLTAKWSGPDAPPFDDLLTEACYWVNEQYHVSEPVQEIGNPRVPIRSERHLLWPFLVEGQINILYADGASLKSMIAMCLGISVRSGRALLPRSRVLGSGAVLYLDYETNQAEQHARALRLSRGAGIELETPMLYRESRLPLRRDAPNLRKIVEESEVTLAIVDSMGAAMGGDPNEMHEVIAAMDVLRSLRCTVLVVDHTTKLDDQGKPVGSAYKWNYSRSAWHAKRVQEADADEVQVALIHTKGNNDKKERPWGYTFTFPASEAERTTGPISVKYLDVRDHPDLQQYTSISDRIRYALRSGLKTAKAIQDELEGVSEAVVLKQLAKLRKTGEVIIIGQQYGMPARRADNGE